MTREGRGAGGSPSFFNDLGASSFTGEQDRITIFAAIDVGHEMIPPRFPETQRCRISIIFGILRLTLVYQKAHGVSAPREEPSYEQNFTRPA